MIDSTPWISNDSAVVVLTSTVSPGNAPRPFTWAERFVFAHAYETLVRVDCLGQPSSGLAKSWTALDGARWRVVLRDGARFWSGDPVTANDVIASWRATGRSPTAVLARHLAERATAIDDTTLEIRGALTPSTLGDPELAVAKRSAQARWPDGSGTYRIREPGRPANPERSFTLLLEPADITTAQRLAVHAVPEVDARDLIDAGVDLLITDDPSVSNYAASRPGTSTMPLGWNRTWVLVTPSTTPAASDSVASTDTVMGQTLALRTTLARDAVRTDARPSSSSPVATPQCTPPAAVATRSSRTSTRVVYRPDEPIARALAERLVALAASGGDNALTVLAPELARTGPRATVAALTPNEFESALRTGNELAFVLPVQARSLDACRAVESLAAAAPWLTIDPTRGNGGATVIPLVDTRPRAVLRRARLNLTVTWDSTVVVARTTPASNTGRP